RLGTQLIYEHKKHRLSGGVRYRDVQIDNTNFFLDTTINQHVKNFLPRARYVYKISQHNRFVINYNTSSSQPSINQLQPVLDNTNPNRITVGNPNLRPNYVHSFSSSYNFYKPLSGTHFWSSLNHSITNDAFGNSTDFDSLGRITSMTINVDGNTSSSLNFGGGFPIFKKLIEVFPNVNMAYAKTISMVNGEENVTRTRNVGAGAEFRIERDSVEFSIGGKYSYNSPTNTISTMSSQPFSSQSYDAKFLWKLPKGFFIETDATYTINSQRAQGYDLNFFIWNASIAKSFLKNQNLITTVHVYDILNQNISANRFVNANVITDTKSIIIARYFMFRVTYKFNSNKTKEADDFF
ncbi:MAG: outer membrane beta-barrel protein, partial [Flavobacteriia bacterium]